MKGERLTNFLCHSVLGKFKSCSPLKNRDNGQKETDNPLWNIHSTLTAMIRNLCRQPLAK